MLINIAPTMTSNTTPSPNIVIASTEYNTTYAAWKAFDKNTTSTRWVTPAGVLSGWLKIDLGSGNEAELLTIGIVSGDGEDRAPKDFTFQGSNNDTDWDTLLTVTGETSWLSSYEKKYFELSATASYRYYKLDVTANNGSANFLDIAELELYDTSPLNTTRLSQLVTEVVSTGSPEVRLAQLVVEVITQTPGAEPPAPSAKQPVVFICT